LWKIVVVAGTKLWTKRNALCRSIINYGCIRHGSIGNTCAEIRRKPDDLEEPFPAHAGKLAQVFATVTSFIPAKRGLSSSSRPKGAGHPQME
jgi:hypothetical protein